MRRSAMIGQYCVKYQTTASHISRFLLKFTFSGVSRPERIFFSHEVAIDLMWLENNPILHVVSTNTHLQIQTVSRSKRAEDIWF